MQDDGETLFLSAPEKVSDHEKPRSIESTRRGSSAARCDMAGVGNFYSVKFRNKLLEFSVPFSYPLDAHAP